MALDRGWFRGRIFLRAELPQGALAGRLPRFRPRALSAGAHLVLRPGRGEFPVLPHGAGFDSRIGWRDRRVVGIRAGRGVDAGLLFCHGPSAPAAGAVFDTGRQPGRGRDFNPVGGHQIMKRIGFIALSGVRAHNEELTKLGLTLPGFVDRNRIIASLPSLGLLTLAGLTPRRFEVEYHEIADLRKETELPEHFDLVAISTFTAQLKEAWRIADVYRSKNIPVVMGGIPVSSLPEDTKEHCASVVVGEGEPLWPEVLDDFERGRLKPFYVQTPRGGFDLREGPMPRFDLLDPDQYNRITVQTSRGCPHRCDFCASSILLTPRYKLKPVEKVIAEIHEIKKIWSRPFIEFADDNSFVNREHYKRLLGELVKERLRWFTEADVKVSEDDELLGLMRDSGCQQVLIGLESPGVASLNGVELKTNWKARQLDSYKAAIAKIQSYGITV